MKLIDLSEDYGTICNWLRLRSIPAIPMHLFSTIGYINDTACCFLYVTNSKVAYLEQVISKPKDKIEEDQGINEVIDACINTAKVLGYEVLLSNTKLDCIIERSKLFGFKVDNDSKLLIKPL